MIDSIVCQINWGIFNIICDLLPQNECKVASLYTEIQPVNHVTKQ